MYLKQIKLIVKIFADSKIFTIICCINICQLLFFIYNNVIESIIFLMLNEFEIIFFRKENFYSIKEKSLSECN